MHEGMDIISNHRKVCEGVLERANRYIEEAQCGRTYFCRKAGVQIHALDVVARGKATPETLQKLSDYLDKVMQVADCEGK